MLDFTGIALAIAELNQIMFTNHIDMSIFVSDRSKKFLVTQVLTTLSLCPCDRIL
ncbi:hypothetical protein GNF10_17555 [Nostoc sp. UCD121]|nr:hypothetical protein [Nostoc sp. UCD121]MBC1295982.1 hypothetical protein [Nostoc sp. UCD122]